MALTFTEKSGPLSIGGKAFRCYQVTHDGSTTTINASDVNLTYIEHAMFSLGTLQSAPAATVTMANSNTYLTFSEALKANSLSDHIIMGW